MKLYLIKCGYVLSGVLIFLCISNVYIYYSKDIKTTYFFSFFILIFILIFKRCETILKTLDETPKTNHKKIKKNLK
ncbi:putative membrane protein [Campylobacter sp. RM5004]|uniref:hypothetical protein n=1 Tax=Campylobacter sp. RM5004 TaxID=1660078 RepID=UPI001EFBFA2B|nr:hypothetical protein [Campylobacter sp. RM5004]ULO01495.1 putative membrane protein [Campylobacter sp. RM5004]